MFHLGLPWKDDKPVTISFPRLTHRYSEGSPVHVYVPLGQEWLSCLSTYASSSFDSSLPFIRTLYLFLRHNSTCHMKSAWVSERPRFETLALVKPVQRTSSKWHDGNVKAVLKTQTVVSRCTYMKSLVLTITRKGRMNNQKEKVRWGSS